MSFFGGIDLKTEETIPRSQIRQGATAFWFVKRRRVKIEDHLHTLKDNDVILLSRIPEPGEALRHMIMSE